MFFQLFEQMTLHKFGQVCVKPANHSGIFFYKIPECHKSWEAIRL